MSIPPFKLERYFGKYEFSVRYLLSPSDCESLQMRELIELASNESRELWDGLQLSYTESQGHPRLRAEISRLYQNIQPEQILVTVPEEAIFILMYSLLRPGDQVISVFPAYQSLYEIARSAGCEVLSWHFEPAPGGWQLDFDWLVDNISERTRLLVVNFPHNPTGYQPKLPEFHAIVDLARKYDSYLFSDEMYRGLEYNQVQRLPSAAELYSNAISLSGLSKTYALPGLRLGWLAVRDSRLLEKMLAFKDYTTICHSAPSEILGLIALQNGQTIIDRNLEIIKRNLRAASEFCTRHPAYFDWLAPGAGSVAFPRWNGEGSIESFCELALEQCGVLIVPGSIFDYPGNYFRIGLGRKNFGAALDQIESLIETSSGNAPKK